MINWFNWLYSIHHYSPMIFPESITIEYSKLYPFLKINDEPLLFTISNDSNHLDINIVFFTYNLRRKIYEYSIHLSACIKSGKIYPIYATDNNILYNIFNEIMCKHLIYYMYLETDKARQLIEEVLEEYKDE